MPLPAPAPFAFDNSYARLPASFFARVAPSAAVAPQVIRFNHDLAVSLGLNLDPNDLDTLSKVFSGAVLPGGAEPIAMAYAGHQFGHFVPQLGDGRAIMLGEVTGRDGLRYDIQLKGAGQTPFSRRGDGRAALGPVLREYVVSEAMAALGVPTTRALAATLTGEVVYRDIASPGAVLTRVARSHLRVGTFQYFAARQDWDSVQVLIDYALERHYPICEAAPNPALALLTCVTQAQAELIAHWLSIGFVHGVMNTDNSAISGQTIDYGPCAFLDTYDPNAVFSSIDEHGRYAYSNQPRIAQWNLARLAETLLPLIDPDTERAIAMATEAVNTFGPSFQAAYVNGLRRKFGLALEHADDLALAQEFLKLMADGQADFTLTFRTLGQVLSHPDKVAALHGMFSKLGHLDEWLARWRARLAYEARDPIAVGSAMAAVNPAIIPRNHHVEAVIQSANTGDFAPFTLMVAAVTRPFDDLPEFSAFSKPPAPHERVERTFCGT